MENKNNENQSLEMADEIEGQSFWKDVWEWMKTFAMAILLAFAIKTIIFSPYKVDGESMMPTLHDQERIIVTKIHYFFSSPQRGDIIVFHAEKDRDFIKRVIAVEGDTLYMKDDQLYINGEKVAEPYLDEYKAAKRDSSPLTRDFESVTVPKGEIYVMGDNRRNSKDSRMIGTVSLDKVVGEAQLVYFPFQNSKLIK